MRQARASSIDFVSPETEVNAGIWTLLAGATAFIALRFWCKLSRRRGLWWDDYILLLAWSALLFTNIIISVEYRQGYVTKTWGDKMLVLVTISSTGVTVGQTWSKTALAVTLLRISNVWQKALLWFIILTLNLYMLLLILVNWFKYCGHKGSQQWWRIQGYCMDHSLAQALKYAGNIYNIIIDFVLALIPWLIVWKLNMKRYEKIGLCVTMSLGIVVAVYSSVRTAKMLDPSSSTYDELYFWHQGLLTVMFQAEVAGTIIVQCIPVIRLLVDDLRTTLFSDQNRKQQPDQPSARPRASLPRKGRASTLWSPHHVVVDDDDDDDDDGDDSGTERIIMRDRPAAFAAKRDRLAGTSPSAPYAADAYHAL